MSTFDLIVSTRADFDLVETRVGWAKLPGPAGACHRAGQRPDPVGRPDGRLRVPTVGRNYLGAARRTRLCPPCGYVHFIVSAALVLAGLAIVATAPKAGAQGREQRPPAFTDEQVERGKSIYQKNCQDCHGSTLDNGEFGGAPLKGSYFRQHWGSGDVSALFGYVNTLMPPDRPGQLSERSYVDLTAFLLSNNGYPAGTEELTADQDAQRKMTMKK